MLLLIGAIGLLTTIGVCRKPGVKYFSIVTVFNRKDKLTEKGATVYLVFFAIALLGIVLNFASKQA
jgi:hypothetical protein